MATPAAKRTRTDMPPLEAWYIVDDIVDQKAENRRTPNVPVAPEELEALGVVYYYLPVPEGVAYPKMSVPWTPNADKTQDADLTLLRKEKGMSYADIITIRPDTLPEYEKKLAAFFEEHIHDDDEVRYILDGAGYFDVRAKDQKGWIRVKCVGGQCITLPKGMYHRFTLDSTESAQAMRLFVGEPIWTPINKGPEVRSFSCLFFLLILLIFFCRCNTRAQYTHTRNHTG